MATKPDDASRRQRLASLGAIAFVVAATAIAFGRVFVGRAPTWRLLIAGLVSVAVAAVFERRSLVLATVASAAALIATLGLLVYPETLWYGVPTARTLEAIGASLGRVGTQARTHVAPTAPLAPLMLAALTAVWTAAFSAHALAARAGSPLLAVLPPAALIGFADTVLEDGARPFYALLLLTAALLLVFVDAMRRIRQWGPVWTAPGRRRLSSVAGRGARRVGAIAVGTALLAPGILPGFRSDPLVDLGSSGDADIDVNPFVSILGDLRRDERREVFRVRSIDEHDDPVGSYWRVRALDRFNGADWDSSDPAGESAFPLPNAIVPVYEIPTIPSTVPTITQHFTPAADVDAGRWLPVAYPPHTIAIPDGEARFQVDVSGLQTASSIGSEDGYAATSYLLRPTPAELNRYRTLPADPRWTSVPAGIGPDLRQLAQDWTDGLSTPYERIFEIQRRFLADDSGFGYTLSPERVAGANPILSFITQTREGYCQQYATAMAAMLRSIDIPARVAIGYRPGTLKDGSFVVTNYDSHAWVEVLFPDYGWLPFDPTPGTWENPVFDETAYLSGNTPQPEGDGVEGAQGVDTPEVSGCNSDRAVLTRVCFDGSSAVKAQAPFDPRRPGPPRDAIPDFTHRGSGAASPPKDAYGIPLRPVFVGFGSIVLALLVLVPLIKAAIRRRILRRGHDARALVLTAYRVFDGEAAEVGMGRRPGETIAEHQRRLASTVRFSDGHLTRLTSAAQTAAYSEAAVDAETVHAARRDAKVAIKDVWRHAGAARRVLGLYRPKI